MRSPQQLTLPLAEGNYNQITEMAFRRALQESYAALRADVVSNRDGVYKPASLALRRHQFLLMGA